MIALLKVILLALFLLALAFLGLGIKLLVKKNGKCPNTSCSSNNKEFSCGCSIETKKEDETSITSPK